MTAFIPHEDLVHRRVYALRSRNLIVGAWNAETNGFIGIREKFGYEYLFTEYERTTGGSVGTAGAIADLGIDVPDGVPLKGFVGRICTKHSRPCAWRASWGSGAAGWNYHLDDESPLPDDDRPRLVDNQELFDLLLPLDEARQAEISAELKATFADLRSDQP